MPWFSIKYQSEIKEEGVPGFLEYLKDYCQCPEKVRNHKQWEQLNMNHVLRLMDYIRKN